MLKIKKKKEANQRLKNTSKKKKEFSSKMDLWRRASAVLKDKNSIILAKFARRTAFRNPDLEEAIIKATSHDEFKVDYKNAQRVFAWVRTSPTTLKSLLLALSFRMEKTRYWVVALKGLMLMHGIFCCRIPAVRKIGRLPFDLSNFNDGHIKSPRIWGFSAFVRAYFAFLDQRSVFDAFEEEKDNKENLNSMVKVLGDLQRSQTLLDLLLQIRPYADEMDVVLILEAMDCIIIEIFDVYSRICNGIAKVLIGIYGANQSEAEMALLVLHKAASQGDELSSYFDFCRDIGVLNASEFPRVEVIPEEDIRDLEQIIDGISKKRDMGSFYEEKSIQVKEIQLIEEQKDSMSLSKTIITENWVVFDDEFKGDGGRKSFSTVEKINHEDPFAASLSVPPLLLYHYNDDFTNSNGLMQLEPYCYPLQGTFPANENQRNLILSL